MIIVFILAIIVLYSVNDQRVENFTVLEEYISTPGNDSGKIIITDVENNLIVIATTVGNFSLSSDGQDIIVTKYTSSNNKKWELLVGGEGIDSPLAAVSDSEGSIYIAGFTQSENFTGIIPGQSFDFSYSGNDGFLVKISPAGKITWATYIGGQEDDIVSGLTIDKDDNIYLIGTTSSENVVAQNKGLTYSHTKNGPVDAFLLKFDRSGALSWSTYYGGKDIDTGLKIAINGSELIIAGLTYSSDFLSQDGLGNEIQGVGELFLSTFFQNGTLANTQVLPPLETKEGPPERFINSILQFSFDLQIDNGSLYLAGSTKNRSFLVNDLSNPVNPQENFAAFVLKYQNRTVEWITIINGSQDDKINSLFVNGTSIYLIGSTFSKDLNTKNSISGSYSGFGDILIGRLNLKGQILFLSYLGGSFLDSGNGIIVSGPNIYITGQTASDDFSPSVDNINGFTDAFLIGYNEDSFTPSIFNSSILGSILQKMSLFEWFIFLSSFIISHRIYQLGRRTKIKDYFILMGLILSIGLVGIFQVLAPLFRFNLLGRFLEVIANPYNAIIVTSYLVFLHSLSVKYEYYPRRIVAIVSTLFMLKLIIIFGFAFQIFSAFNSSQNEKLLIVFLSILYDLLILSILFVSYLTIDLVFIRKEVKRSYYLWLLTWLIFTVTYIMLLSISVIQFNLLYLNQLDENTPEFFINYTQNLIPVIFSGIYFIPFFILISYIALRNPIALLISKSQIIAAIEMYTIMNISGKGLYPESEDTFLREYLNEALQIDATKRDDKQ